MSTNYDRVKSKALKKAQQNRQNRVEKTAKQYRGGKLNKTDKQYIAGDVVSSAGNKAWGYKNYGMDNVREFYTGGTDAKRYKEKQKGKNPYEVKYVYDGVKRTVPGGTREDGSTYKSFTSKKRYLTDDEKKAYKATGSTNVDNYDKTHNYSIMRGYGSDGKTFNSNLNTFDTKSKKFRWDGMEVAKNRVKNEGKSKFNYVGGFLKDVVLDPVVDVVKHFDRLSGAGMGAVAGALEESTNAFEAIADDKLNPLTHVDWKRPIKNAKSSLIESEKTGWAKGMGDFFDEFNVRRVKKAVKEIKASNLYTDEEKAELIKRQEDTITDGKHKAFRHGVGLLGDIATPFDLGEIALKGIKGATKNTSKAFKELVSGSADVSMGLIDKDTQKLTEALKARKDTSKTGQFLQQIKGQKKIDGRTLNKKYTQTKDGYIPELMRGTDDVVKKTSSKIDDKQVSMFGANGSTKQYEKSIELDSDRFEKIYKALQYTDNDVTKIRKDILFDTIDDMSDSNADGMLDWLKQNNPYLYDEYMGVLDDADPYIHKAIKEQKQQDILDAKKKEEKAHKFITDGIDYSKSPVRKYIDESKILPKEKVTLTANNFDELDKLVKKVSSIKSKYSANKNEVIRDAYNSYNLNRLTSDLNLKGKAKSSVSGLTTSFVDGGRRFVDFVNTLNTDDALTLKETLKMLEGSKDAKKTSERVKLFNQIIFDGDNVVRFNINPKMFDDILIHFEDLIDYSLAKKNGEFFFSPRGNYDGVKNGKFFFTNRNGKSMKFYDKFAMYAPSAVDEMFDTKTSDIATMLGVKNKKEITRPLKQLKDKYKKGNLSPEEFDEYNRLNDLLYKWNNTYADVKYLGSDDYFKHRSSKMGLKDLNKDVKSVFDKILANNKNLDANNVVERLIDDPSNPNKNLYQINDYENFSQDGLFRKMKDKNGQDLFPDFLDEEDYERMLREEELVDGIRANVFKLLNLKYVNYDKINLPKNKNISLNELAKNKEIKKAFGNLKRLAHGSLMHEPQSLHSKVINQQIKYIQNSLEKAGVDSSIWIDEFNRFRQELTSNYNRSINPLEQFGLTINNKYGVDGNKFTDVFKNNLKQENFFDSKIFDDEYADLLNSNHAKDFIDSYGGMNVNKYHGMNDKPFSGDNADNTFNKSNKPIEYKNKINIQDVGYVNGGYANKAYEALSRYEDYSDDELLEILKNTPKIDNKKRTTVEYLLQQRNVDYENILKPNSSKNFHSDVKELMKKGKKKYSSVAENVKEVINNVPKPEVGVRYKNLPKLSDLVDYGFGKDEAVEILEKMKSGELPLPEYKYVEKVGKNGYSNVIESKISKTSLDKIFGKIGNASALDVVDDIDDLKHSIDINGSIDYSKVPPDLPRKQWHIKELEDGTKINLRTGEVIGGKPIDTVDISDILKEEKNAKKGISNFYDELEDSSDLKGSVDYISGSVSRNNTPVKGGYRVVHKHKGAHYGQRSPLSKMTHKLDGRNVIDNKTGEVKSLDDFNPFNNNVQIPVKKQVKNIMNDDTVEQIASDIEDNPISELIKRVQEEELFEDFNGDIVPQKGSNPIETKLPYESDKLYQGYKAFLNSWKKGLTIYNPGWHVQNFFQNKGQNYLGLGSDAFSSQKKARDVLKRINGQAGDEVLVKGANNKMYTTDELADWAKKLGIAEGWGTSTSKVHGIMPGLEAGVENSKLMKKLLESEQTARLHHFIKKLERGEDLEGATKSVNKYLFDYGRKSKADKVASDFIDPFWTFHKNNARLLLSQGLENPAKTGNIIRAHRELDKMSEDDRSNSMSRDYQLPFGSFKDEVNGDDYDYQFNENFLPSLDEAIPIEGKDVKSKMNPLLRILTDELQGVDTWGNKVVDGEAGWNETSRKDRNAQIVQELNPFMNPLVKTLVKVHGRQEKADDGTQSQSTSDKQMLMDWIAYITGNKGNYYRDWK